MGAPDGRYVGWAYRPPARLEPERCSANWEQEEWSFWCSLPAAHDGPHQEAGLAEECRYLVLWDDAPGHSDGEHGAGSEGPPFS